MARVDIRDDHHCDGHVLCDLYNQLVRSKLSSTLVQATAGGSEPKEDLLERREADGEAVGAARERNDMIS